MNWTTETKKLSYPLRDQLEASERRFAETGRYQGIENLDVLRTRPMDLERLHSRLATATRTIRTSAPRSPALHLREHGQDSPQNVFAKLGVKTRTEALFEARRRKLIA